MAQYVFCAKLSDAGNINAILASCEKAQDTDMGEEAPLTCAFPHFLGASPFKLSQNKGGFATSSLCFPYVAV
ncbi:MAG TPA: hypothetical protein DDW73_08925 [Rhizobium sp.]|nr:hypothetical protein [Rhizobium sp.]